MANYNVGNIEIGVITDVKNSASQINTLIQKINQVEKLEKSIQDSFISINKLSNGIRKLEKTNLNSLTSKFNQISSATKSLNANLSNIGGNTFGDVATSLNKLGNAFRQFDKLKDFDFRKMYNSFQSLNRILAPFLDKLKQSEASLVAMNGVMSSLKTKTLTNATKELKVIDKQTKSISKNADNGKKGFGKMLGALGKIYFFINYSKRIVQTFANVVKASVDFEETLNKFQVSFAELGDEATAFANKLTYSFNLSRQSLMDYMSTFNSMLKSLGGISTNQAYDLSTTLTQLALDYSSLFNVTVDSAMKSFQSVLSGQIRTIRSVSGIDVSENTIFQYYQELGGDKSMRQLSQLEKRLLRIYALEKQLNSLGAVGDLNKTINSTSNVLKQITETTQELFVYLGNISKQVFQPILKNVLALMLVLKDVSKAIATAQGALTTEYSTSGNNLFGDIEETAENASDSLDNLLGKFGFDKFESLSSSSDTVSELDSIINAIALYNTQLNQTASDSRKIADNLLNWLGYTKVINEETGETNLILSGGYTNLSKITDLVLGLISLGLSTLIIKLTKSVVTFLIAISDIEKSTLKLNKIMGTLLLANIINIMLNWDKMSTVAKVLSVTIGLVNASLLVFRNMLDIRKFIAKAILEIGLLNDILKLYNMNLLTIGISAGIAFAGLMIFNQVGKWSDDVRILVGVLSGLVAVLTAVALAVMAIQTTLTLGVAVPLITTGLTAGAIAVKSAIEGFANGGFPTKGQMFIANEAGPELVGNIGGNTAVANNDMIVQAIENASYRGMSRAVSETQGNNNEMILKIDGNSINNNALARAITPALKLEQRRTGGR